jgi:LmbE family N-acetylglucosaminyl deacetylase
MRKLLAIFAHPDDEGAVAGTLAYYARHDTKVMLICATKGEVGEISDPALATPETLGEVRTAELRAACDIIGIGELHFLGYRDSGMPDTQTNEDPRALVQAKPEEAIERLVILMHQLKPDIVITFEPFGWYGHPDHQAISHFATTAYERVRGETVNPTTGQSWQPQRLFHTVMPISKLQIMFEYARANNLIDTHGFFEDVPVEMLKETEAQITHVLDVRHLFETRQAAAWVHRTQFGEDNWFRKLPEDITRPAWAYEYFIQVQPAPIENLRRHHATDLFEG